MASALVDQVRWEERDVKARRRQHEAYLNAPVQLRVYLVLPELLRLWGHAQGATDLFRQELDKLIHHLSYGAMTKCPGAILVRLTKALQHDPLPLPEDLSFTLKLKRTDAEHFQRLVPHSLFTQLVSKTSITALDHGKETQRSENSEA